MFFAGFCAFRHNSGRARIVQGWEIGSLKPEVGIYQYFYLLPMPIFIFLSCSCTDGWFGVMCREESTVCTTGKHACAEGSECAVHPNGTYFCLCPFGRRGTLCDEGSRPCPCPYMIRNSKVITHIDVHKFFQPL